MPAQDFLPLAPLPFGACAAIRADISSKTGVVIERIRLHGAACASAPIIKAMFPPRTITAMSANSQQTNAATHGHVGSLRPGSGSGSLRVGSGSGRLDLRQCGVNDEWCEQLAQVWCEAIDLSMQACSIYHADLSCNCLRARACAALAQVLQKSQYLTHLNISHNLVDARGLVSLCDGLLTNLCLSYLALSHNRFCPLGGVGEQQGRGGTAGDGGGRKTGGKGGAWEKGARRKGVTEGKVAKKEGLSVVSDEEWQQVSAVRDEDVLQVLNFEESNARIRFESQRRQLREGRGGRRAAAAEPPSRGGAGVSVTVRGGGVGGGHRRGVAGRVGLLPSLGKGVGVGSPGRGSTMSPNRRMIRGASSPGNVLLMCCLCVANVLLIVRC